MKASINFKIEQQVMSNWCWAAAATSMFRHYKKNSGITQQKFVSDILDLPQCEVSPSAACNKQYSLTEALRSLEIFDSVENKASRIADIYEEFLNDKPVALLLSNPVNGGHFVVASGINTTPSGAIITFQDPIDASTRTVRYSVLVSDFQGSCWTKTYFTRNFSV